MTPSLRLIEYLKGWEDCHLEPQQDRVNPNVWDYGYGHVCARDARPLASIEAAEELLREDVEVRAVLADEAIAVPVAQHEFDAFVSILYNVGPGKAGVKDGVIVLANGRPSTLLRKINEHDFDGAAAEFAKWNKSNGGVVRGLIRRREGDVAIFRDADYSRRP